ncbi:hypothetical protein GCM10012275_18920 [Longimycelium tulufanense]|uniref:Uncharacterized protein n=1 Tax=Longimycelium tulufanense TaxID=907463 RepID=A0A8J3C7F8_9PSEU|nr:hypothetical protein GCM10012275_18920 [Longimycelium tulufanense]
MQFQDPGTTRPRPPTLAEQKARQRAEAREREQQQAELARAEHRAKIRRRVLIGSGVTVGVVALIAISYAATRPQQVTAHCVQQDGTVVDDQYCDESYVRSHGGHVGGGIIFLPGGGQYYYNYGGTGRVGDKISGGSTVKPQGAEVKTQSGKTIQRGGFGIKGSSGS